MQTLGLQSILLYWGMEVQCPRVDGGDGRYRDWKLTRARTSEAHRHSVSVFFWVHMLVTKGKTSLGKKPTKEILADFLTKHVDAATMLNCMSGSGLKYQSGESKLTLKRELGTRNTVNNSKVIRSVCENMSYTNLKLITTCEMSV